MPLGTPPPLWHLCCRTAGCRRWCCGTERHPDDNKVREQNEASEDIFMAAERETEDGRYKQQDWGAEEEEQSK